MEVLGIHHTFVQHALAVARVRKPMQVRRHLMQGVPRLGQGALAKDRLEHERRGPQDRALSSAQGTVKMVTPLDRETDGVWTRELSQHGNAPLMQAHPITFEQAHPVLS